MVENTNEEHLDNPGNSQPESLTDEIISTHDTEAINPIQQIEIWKYINTHIM